ncbi:1,4-dihydroxy-2-naphthoyl-CoA hydrolase [Stanieria cyanosphaera PCC 7437]|uniref:1,4-dihydroxy-2-naphthoyl-CoA hydrolase n=1 Tax=Stanieria cyanosphaera (strain ATCC 29371 / PCC 7437) TaxID=111780 RepID=K9XZP7_STAC7|nr:thioesterase family protein [Stanieria cyanosphaera]AFZ37586.1 1,4-dihydroxy-2-naphthoyl-CoA hydrolase [Stanieria cyanosphaera PCC 7437]
MVFAYSRRIYLADTDAAGVVYFASLMSICHQAYEESLAMGGISLQDFLADSSVAIPIVHSEMSFFRPIFCGDKITINLTAKQLNKPEFAIAYQIVASEKKLAQGSTRHVCINPKTRIKIPLPENIIQWLKLVAEEDSRGKDNPKIKS